VLGHPVTQAYDTIKIETSLTMATNLSEYSHATLPPDRITSCSITSQTGSGAWPFWTFGVGFGVLLLACCFESVRHGSSYEGKLPPGPRGLPLAGEHALPHTLSRTSAPDAYRVPPILEPLPGANAGSLGQEVWADLLYVARLATLRRGLRPRHCQRPVGDQWANVLVEKRNVYQESDRVCGPRNHGDAIQREMVWDKSSQRGMRLIGW
jgi:hypothetical protein